MLKSEVLAKAVDNNIKLTDSQFRRYVQFGLITSKRISKGKGNGVESIYPLNSLEIIQAIHDGKEFGFIQKDLIYYLFSKGFLIDYEKLKHQLIIDCELMINNLKNLISKTKDSFDREWLITEMTSENLPKKIPGRPSHHILMELNEKRIKEQAKVNSVLDLIEEILDLGNITQTTINLFSLQLDYTNYNSRSIPTDWIDTKSWNEVARNASYEDFKMVQHTFNLFGMYNKVFKELQPESRFINMYIIPLFNLYKNSGLKNFLYDPELIKLVLILLLANPKWTKGLNDILTLYGVINNDEELKQALPILLSKLDMHINGGDPNNV
jgi:hypothetical protein